MRKRINPRVFSSSAALFAYLLFAFTSCGSQQEGDPAPRSEARFEDKQAIPKASLAREEFENPLPGSPWSYVIETLFKQGVPISTLKEIYSDKRLPAWTPIPFQSKPAETTQQYSSFLLARSLQKARVCFETHRPTLEKVSRQFEVDPSVLAALIFVETKCGEYLGQELVIHRLSRLVALSEPSNQEWNYKRLRSIEPGLKKDAVQSRAAYLLDTFSPEIPALIDLAHKNKEDILEVRGSMAGAFGIPQFLPSSALRFGVDGNADGKVSLFDIEDALPSAARYLSHFGWKNKLSWIEKKKVLWNYNKSDPYGETVLRIGVFLSQFDHPAQPIKNNLKQAQGAL